MPALILLLLAFSSAIVAAEDISLPSDPTICAYPLSPTYSLLQRAQIYTLILFTLLNPLKTPLFHGALATLMAKSAVVAFHAFALLHPLVRGNNAAAPPPLDLDLIGTWAILSQTTCCLAFLLSWSAALRGSKALPIVRVWGILIVAGTICSYAALRKARYGGIFASPVEEDGTGSASCHASGVYLRGDEHAVVVLDGTVWSADFDALLNIAAPFVLFAAALGLLTCFLASGNQRLKQAAEELYVGDVGTSTLTGSRSWEPGPSRKAALVLVAAAPAVVLGAELVLQERYMKISQLPTMESPSAVGQWGSWLGMGLVVLAAIVGKSMEEKAEMTQQDEISVK